MKKDAGTDLVDAGMFLRGCREPMEQYRECLMKNLKDWHGRLDTKRTTLLGCTWPNSVEIYHLKDCP
ncbi:unnamed protein product [Ectocarpus sp. CCAP 1310/34]|nr:unnamed protein product [Ectocarpus sp. CCAP 1310/34]